MYSSLVCCNLNLFSAFANVALWYHNVLWSYALWILDEEPNMVPICSHFIHVHRHFIRLTAVGNFFRVLRELDLFRQIIFVIYKLADTEATVTARTSHLESFLTITAADIWPTCFGDNPWLFLSSGTFISVFLELSRNLEQNPEKFLDGKSICALRDKIISGHIIMDNRACSIPCSNFFH